MPIYKFTCDAGHITEEYRPVSDYVEYVRCAYPIQRVSAGNHKLSTKRSSCGLRANITICANLQVNTFKPYVEENMTGKPIHITSKDQRDQLCKQHGVSYDSNKYHSKPRRKAAVEDITLGDVKDAINSGRLPDGQKLEDG